MSACHVCAAPAPEAHSPCCSSAFHAGKPLCCDHYCRYHYVEVNKCTPADHEQVTA